MHIHDREAKKSTREYRRPMKISIFAGPVHQVQREEKLLCRTAVNNSGKRALRERGCGCSGPGGASKKG